MANYYATSRSNYFEVKDPEAFEEELSKIDLRVVRREEEGKTMVALIMDTDDCGAVPGWIFDEETDDEMEIDWADIFQRHLVPDNVAIMLEAGAEKYRYVSGLAWAFNHKGEELWINLSDIYTKVDKEWPGLKYTRAEY